MKMVTEFAARFSVLWGLIELAAGDYEVPYLSPKKLYILTQQSNSESSLGSFQGIAENYFVVQTAINLVVNGAFSNLSNGIYHYFYPIVNEKSELLEEYEKLLEENPEGFVKAYKKFAADKVFLERLVVKLAHLHPDLYEQIHGGTLWMEDLATRVVPCAVCEWYICGYYVRKHCTGTVSSPQPVVGWTVSGRTG